MAEELFDIYDENMKPIGVLERSKVHQKGYWHKAFHCWFYQIDDGMLYVLFQKRQKDKDTHPCLLDITAAGHLSAGELPEDGIREVEEELGVKVKLEDLQWIDVIPSSYIGETFIDNEFCYTYFYQFSKSISTIVPDIVEVSGIYRIPYQDFVDLYNGKVKNVKIDGLEYNDNQLVNNRMKVELHDFVPHPDEYYDIILNELSSINSRFNY